MASKANFRASVLQGLEERDQHEHIPFRSMFDEYSTLLTQNKLYASKQNELQSELAATKSALSEAKHELSLVHKLGTIDTQKRILELESTLSVTKSELSDLYKYHGLNAQRLLEFTSDLYKKDETIAQKEAENSSLRESAKQFESKTDEKTTIIHVLQDELQALQLELVKTEERVHELENENKGLLECWLKKMNEEAGKMNEALTAYEDIRQRKGNENHITSPSMTVSTIRHPTASDGRLNLPATNDSTIQSTFSARTIPCIPSFSGLSITDRRHLPTRLRRQFVAHDGEINSLCITHLRTTNPTTSSGYTVYNPMFATGGSDKRVHLFDANSGQLKLTLTGSLQSVMCVQFNPTNEMILASSNDNATRLWSVHSGRLKHTFTGHIAKVLSAKFSSDSSKVLSASHDRSIKVWDLNKAYCVRTIFCFSSCNDVAILDEGTLTVASGHLDHHLRFWDVRTGDCIHEMAGIHSGQITGLSLSPDGSSLLTISRDNTLKLIDLRMRQFMHIFSADTFRTAMNWSKASFSPDGNFVAAGGQDGLVYIWNAKNGSGPNVEVTLKGHGAPISNVAWNHTSEQMYSVDRDGRVIMWSMNE